MTRTVLKIFSIGKVVILHPDLALLSKRMFFLIICTQCVQGGFLFCRESFGSRDIEAFIGTIAAEGTHQLGALHSPQLDGAIISTTGDQAAIGTHLHCMNGILMALKDVQDLPMVHVPPAHGSIV